MPNQLYRKLSKKGFRPAHVAEVGVHQPKSSNVYDYIVERVRCTLVEPDPDCVLAIRRHFSAFDNVKLHPVAAYDFSGRLELARRGASTFVAELTHTPATVNDRYRVRDGDKFLVSARTFDEIDDGTIVLLSIDVEGSEWFVIKHLTSRPAVISVETHGSRYRNPYFREIADWMEENGYILWYRDTSDSVFVKRGSVRVGRWDRMVRAMVAIYLAYKSASKRVRHALKPVRAA